MSVMLASLPGHIAVLDREGTIIAVNDAWLEFGRTHGVRSDDAIGVGANYLEACRDGSRAGEPGAADALAMVEAACRGEHSSRRIDFRCDSPRERWFAMSAEPLRWSEGGAIVSHIDITDRKLADNALRESEARFRRIADALPVAIWMSEADGARTYFNQQWLQMTGRALDQEVGTGWLEGVHPEDRPGFLTTYLQAIAERQAFCTEYRIRRFDGEYRWLMVTGIPRYTSDGVFDGYVGGCVDITDRREAEQLARDLNRHLIVAQEEERRRIARELHDHLSQQLALIAIDLQQLSTSPPDDPATLVTALHEQWRRTAEIASDVHGISHRLHPSKLEALGLVATVRSHCRDVSRQHFAVRFSEEDVPAAIPPDVALCVFRVLEEALNNVVRHSGASEADVALLSADGDLVLRVFDSGRGFGGSGSKLSGLGLVSMRERLQLVDGTLSITSAEGGGTLVEARVPLESLNARHVQESSRAVATSGGFSFDGRDLTESRQLLGAVTRIQQGIEQQRSQLRVMRSLIRHPRPPVDTGE